LRKTNLLKSPIQNHSNDANILKEEFDPNQDKMMQKLVFTNSLNKVRTRVTPVLESIHIDKKGAERLGKTM